MEETNQHQDCQVTSRRLSLLAEPFIPGKKLNTTSVLELQTRDLVMAIELSDTIIREGDDAATGLNVMK